MSFNADKKVIIKTKTSTALGINSCTCKLKDVIESKREVKEFYIASTVFCSWKFTFFGTYLKVWMRHFKVAYPKKQQKTAKNITNSHLKKNTCDHLKYIEYADTLHCMYNTPKPYTQVLIGSESLWLLCRKAYSKSIT